MKHQLISCGAILLALLSCNPESPDTTPTPNNQGNGTQTPKILKIAENNLEDAFLVKLGSVPTSEDLSALESALGTCLTPVFPSTPGKETLEHRYGLDRWFQAEVPQEEHLDKMVQKASLLEQVALVEYCAVAQKDVEGGIYEASPATKGTMSGSFNDPYLSYQWHYKNSGDRSVSPSALSGADINVWDVWTSLTCGDPGIVVAVVDEGVKYTHPDLKDNMWVNKDEIPGNGIDDDGNGYIDDVYGFNFVTNGPISWDVVDAQGNGDSGHATHCAGTIAAVNNNGTGVAGVAGGSGNGDGCRIMSCQIFSGNAGGSSSITAKAIKYAADMGASIISCSFGLRVAYASDNAYIKRQGSVEIDAIHYFEDSENANNPVLNGNIAIFSAGNETHDFCHYPGAFYDIISVSAFGPDGLPTYYTNYGPGCNISAPGGEAYHVVNKWNSMVLSTVPSELPQLGVNGEINKTGLNYGYMQGTSMACPHVSGVVALGLSYAKKLGKTFDRDDFKKMILASVNDIDQRIAKTPEKKYAYYQSALNLTPYYHQMGTGAIDAWRLMMHIEGTPTLTAKVGQKQWIDLTSIFGTASISLTYLEVEVQGSAAQSMGLQKIMPTNADKYPAVIDAGGYAYVQFGRLYIHPTLIGSGKIKITAVGGGDHLGGGDNPPGGMELVEEVSLISREADGGNGTGGWL